MSNATNTVNINGKDIPLLPLNWKQLKACRAEIILLNNMSSKATMFTEEQQDAILKVVTASLSRSEPSYTEEYVSEYLDLGNVNYMLRGVFGQKNPQPGEAPGEAQAATSPT